MEILRGKTPEIVRKEIYAFLLAYNLLRTLMWEAGTTYGVAPLRLSLQGTRHHLDNFIPELLVSTDKKRYHIYQTLLKIIVYKSVPDRPGRVEPRVIAIATSVRTKGRIEKNEWQQKWQNHIVMTLGKKSSQQ